jgi:AcrR family transcriptional regulator
MTLRAKIIEPRWERRKDARHGELTAAALEIFVEKGFAATRLDDVAKRAGVSKGTLYLYFESKEELFKAVVREGIVAELGEAEEFIDTFPGTAADLLREIMHRWWLELDASRLAGITKLMMAEAGNFPELARFYHGEVIERAHVMLSRAMERGIASGEFREINLDYAARICCAPMVMLSLWRHSFGPCAVEHIDPGVYLETHLDMLIHSLRASGAPECAKGSLVKAAAGQDICFLI